MAQPAGIRASTVNSCSVDGDNMMDKECTLMGYVVVQSEVHRRFGGIY
jgi:hypothetical protein